MSVKDNRSRRKFIRNSALALGSAAMMPGELFAGSPSQTRVSADKGSFSIGFDQSPLGYSYDALEPAIDAMTMEIHYSKHAAVYSKTLKEAAVAENIDSKKTVDDILANVSKYSSRIRNNGGGHYNHELFWKTLSPSGSGKPSGKLLTAIEKEFNAFDAFKNQFGEAATTRFGSGWAWLIITPGKKLRITSTPNQDNPLMDIAEVKGFPLLGLDVWEHAYYLKYQNQRAEYIENWWKIVNWAAVEQRFNEV